MYFYAVISNIKIYPQLNFVSSHRVGNVMQTKVKQYIIGISYHGECVPSPVPHVRALEPVALLMFQQLVPVHAEGHL